MNRPVNYIRILSGFSLALMLGLTFLGGCKSQPKFEQMTDRQLIYQGAGKKHPELQCSFNLQTIYFSGFAIDSYLYLTLKNGMTEALPLNASKDKLAIVIQGGQKYTIAPGSSPDYKGEVKAGGVFKTRFRSQTESLMFHAERREITSVEYQPAAAEDMCVAKPKES